MRHRRPPARSLGAAVLAAGAALVAVLIAVIASVALTGGSRVPGGGDPAVALEVSAADTDGDGVPDGSPLVGGPARGPHDAGSAGADPADGANPADARDGGDVGEPVAARSGPAAAGDPAPDGAATPIDAARGFVAALARGDTEAAYRLMHPRYRDAFGSYAGFAAQAPTARFAPFAVLGSAHYQSAVFDAPVVDEPVAVVSTYGVVHRDGADRADVLGVVTRRGDEGWLVEVAGEGGSAFQRPEAPGEQVAAAEPLVVWTPAEGVGEVVAALDGEPATATVTPLADPPDTVEIRIGERAPDTRQVLVGVLRADGSVDVVATFLGS